jgi:FtsH Extracellular
MTTNLPKFTIWAIIILLLVGGAIVGLAPDQYSEPQEIAFSQFLNEVDQGKVRAVIRGLEIRGTYRDGRSLSTYAPDDPALVQRLRGKNVVIAARPVQDMVSWVVSWLPFIVLISVWLYLARRLRGGVTGFFNRFMISAIPVDDPRHWRGQANVARAAAERLTDTESRRQLMDIAAGYEQLALRTGKGPDDSGSPQNS